MVARGTVILSGRAYRNYGTAPMARQLTEEITKEFEARLHVVFNHQDKRFNKIMKHIRVKNRLAEESFRNYVIYYRTLAIGATRLDPHLAQPLDTGIPRCQRITSQ